MDLSFFSLKDIYGTNYIYHLRSTIQRKADESIENGHFLAYIFDGKKCRVYDDNKINYVRAKLVLEDDEFQKIFTQLAIFLKLTISKLHLFLIVIGH